MAYTYEIGAANAIIIWDDRDGPTNKYIAYKYETKPDGEPWATRQEAESYAEAIIQELIASGR